MATIVKGKNPGKPYTVRYQHDGRQREKSFRTAREAGDFKAKFEHDSRENTFVDPRVAKINFCDYAAQCVQARSLAPNTKRLYLAAVEKIRKELGSRTLAQVASDREGVQLLIAGLTGAATTRQTALSVIKHAADEAVRAGKVTGHRLDGITVPKDGKAEAQIIPATKGQLEQIAAELGECRALLVWLMRGCGLRIGEALAVRLSAFRSDGTILRVSEQVIKDGSLGPLKHRKRNEYRDVPVPAWVWELVKVHVRNCGSDDYLFMENGQSVTYWTVYGRFTRAAKKTGLEGMTPHSLRHVYASTLLAALVPITDVARWMGHRDINETFATYSHLMPEGLDRGRKALETI